MITVTCAIALTTDAARKIKVQLNKDGDDLTWKVLESSREGLKTKSSKGKWIAPFDWSKILTLIDDSGGIVLVAYKIKNDFWNDLTSNKTIETDDAELYNGNPSETKVTVKLSNGS